MPTAAVGEGPPVRSGTGGEIDPALSIALAPGCAITIGGGRATAESFRWRVRAGFRQRPEDTTREGVLIWKEIHAWVGRRLCEHDNVERIVVHGTHSNPTGQESRVWGKRAAEVAAERVGTEVMSLYRVYPQVSSWWPVYQLARLPLCYRATAEHLRVGTRPHHWTLAASLAGRMADWMHESLYLADEIIRQYLRGGIERCTDGRPASSPTSGIG